MSSKRMARMIGNTSSILGQRTSFWLGIAYPGAGKRKRIAREFDVSEGTARNWLGGICPTQEYLGQMARKWGWRFVQFIHAPLVESDCDEIQDRLDAARARGLAGMAEARE